MLATTRVTGVGNGVFGTEGSAAWCTPVTNASYGRVSLCAARTPRTRRLHGPTTKRAGSAKRPTSTTNRMDRILATQSTILASTDGAR